MKAKNVKNYIWNLVLSAMFMAIGLVLPFFTGQIPQIGSMPLPMHLPVLLCGLISVSYTHLDVYKRQAREPTGWSASWRGHTASRRPIRYSRQIRPLRRQLRRLRDLLWRAPKTECNARNQEAPEHRRFV